MHTQLEPDAKLVSNSNYAISPFNACPVSLSAPIVCKTARKPREFRAENRSILATAEFCGHRVQVKLGFEAWCRFNGKWQYRRLRRAHLVVNATDEEQAILAIDAILAFAQSLDGKTLAPEPTPSGLKVGGGV